MGITNQWHTYNSHNPGNQPGVYELGNSSGTVQYIGRSSDLGQRISDHATADGRSCIGRDTTRFRYEITASHVTRERELFREYKRTHGDQIPPCNTQDPSA